MKLQEKYNNITENLKEFEGFYYPKSAFSSDEIQELLKYFDIEEIKMTPELANIDEKIEWTNEWHYIFRKLIPDTIDTEQPQDDNIIIPQ